MLLACDVMRVRGWSVVRNIVRCVAIVLRVGE